VKQTLQKRQGGKAASRLEQQVKTLRKLLNEARAEADRLRESLARNERVLLSTRLLMGHEVKKPTIAIAGYLDLAGECLEGLDDPKAQEALDWIRKARKECRVLDELNRFFLDLVKVGRNGESPKGRPVDLEAFLNELLSHFPRELEALQRVRIDVDPSARRIVFDEDALEVVLSNVLENALLYSKKGTLVKVNAQACLDQRQLRRRRIVKISVRDFGMGIPEEHLDRIFNPFVRLHRGVAEGSGLGLTLVKSLLELYGGEISIRSSNGRGTTVYLTLPVLEAEAVEGVKP
jgi:signal transduction histidine kinase